MFIVKEIIKSAKARLVCGDAAAAVRGFSIDSRTVREGDIFIAIKGGHFDGHDFMNSAFKKGAAGAIVSEDTGKRKARGAGRKVIVLVKDTVKALCQIARGHRMKFRDLKVVAVTGSNGKTTTKELIAKALSPRFNVLKNEASFNNFIGLPLTLLRLTPKHTACVLEMGMNHPGEIGALAEIARPQTGVITNIGPSHLEFLKTLKNIFIAKSELLENLSGRRAAILNKDDEFLKNIKPKNPCRKVFFGIDSECDFQAGAVEYRLGAWNFRLRDYVFRIPLLGAHNVYNALAAIAAASALGADLGSIREALKNFKLKCPGRMSSMNVNGLSIIDDTYNSNPLSMRYAVNTLSECKAKGRRILVTGDMLELGGAAKAFHADIGKLVAQSRIDVLITMGALSKFAARSALTYGMPKRCVFEAGSHNDAASFLKRISGPGDVVLIKGSRNMAMEKIIKNIRGHK